MPVARWDLDAIHGDRLALLATARSSRCIRFIRASRHSVWNSRSWTWARATAFFFPSRAGARCWSMEAAKWEHFIPAGCAPELMWARMWFRRTCGRAGSSGLTWWPSLMRTKITLAGFPPFLKIFAWANCGLGETFGARRMNNSLQQRKRHGVIIKHLKQGDTFSEDGVSGKRPVAGK